MKGEFLEFPDFDSEPEKGSPWVDPALRETIPPNVAELLEDMDIDLISIQVLVPYSHDKSKQYRGPVIMKDNDRSFSQPWKIVDWNGRYNSFGEAMVAAATKIDLLQHQMVQQEFEEMLKKYPHDDA